MLLLFCITKDCLVPQLYLYHSMASKEEKPRTIISALIMIAQSCSANNVRITLCANSALTGENGVLSATNSSNSKHLTIHTASSGAVTLAAAENTISAFFFLFVITTFPGAPHFPGNGYLLRPPVGGCHFCHFLVFYLVGRNF